MDYATALLWLNAVVFAAYGLGFIFWPNQMANLTSGVAPSDASTRTDIRATYGGFMLAVGLWLGWAANADNQSHAALLAILFIMLGMASARAYGMLVDGNSNRYIYVALVCELLMSALVIPAL